MTVEEAFRAGYRHGRQDEREATRDFARFVNAELAGLQRDLAALGEDVHRYTRIERAVAVEREADTVLH